MTVQDDPRAVPSISGPLNSTPKPDTTECTHEKQRQLEAIGDEYARLTSQPELSECEMKRMAEIWEQAESDEDLNLLITAIEEFSLQEQGFIDRETVLDSENTDQEIVTSRQRM